MANGADSTSSSGKMIIKKELVGEIAVADNRYDNYRPDYRELRVNCRYKRLLRTTTHGLCLWRQLIQKSRRKSYHTLKKTVCVHYVHCYVYTMSVDFVNDVK